ncbi:MAG: hypothetical protein JWO56_1623 [Acidobacteria bacterium]|nr:hypothetical protein [Acidobacteriota bacterium]
MNDHACARYLEDPEANAAHLAGCEACRALFGELEETVEHPPLAIGMLPLAPWEGSRHRAWALVLFGAVGVCALAVALFLVAGVSPLHGVAAATRVPSPESAMTMAADVSHALMRSAGGWIVLGFLVTNAVLFALLRRAPRGVDASIR